MKLPRVNKNVVMLLIALIVGAGAVYYANYFIEQQISAYKKQLESKQEMVEVVVPKRNLPRGTRIDPVDLATRAVPVDYVPSGVVTEATYSNAEGQRLNFDVHAGKPLMWAHLENGSVPTFSGKLPEGLRALTIRVDEVNSLSGFLQPGDKIDLMLTYNGGKSDMTIPLLQNILVLATGSQTVAEQSVEDAHSTNTFSTATLQLTPEEAKKIILAESSGKITALLRHPEDGSLLTKEPMTFAKMLGNDVKRQPKAVLRQEVSVQEKPKVEFIIGGVGGDKGATGVDVKFLEKLQERAEILKELQKTTPDMSAKVGANSLLSR